MEIKKVELYTMLLAVGTRLDDLGLDLWPWLLGLESLPVWDDQTLKLLSCCPATELENDYLCFRIAFYSFSFFLHCIFEQNFFYIAFLSLFFFFFFFFIFVWVAFLILFFFPFFSFLFGLHFWANENFYMAFLSQLKFYITLLNQLRFIGHVWGTFIYICLTSLFFIFLFFLVSRFLLLWF